MLYTILPITCYAFGSHWLACARIKVITNEFDILSRKLSNGCDKEQMKQFFDIIDDISDGKELSDLSLDDFLSVLFIVYLLFQNDCRIF